MTTLSRDTKPEAEQIQLQLLRQAPTWRKLRMIGEMHCALCRLALSGLHQRYPQAGERYLRRCLADLLLGPELATQIYGPLSDKEGR